MVELKLFSFCQENQNMLGADIPRPSQVKSICTFTGSLDFHSPSYLISSCVHVSTTQETTNEILLNKRKSIYPIRNARENTSLHNTRQSHKKDLTVPYQ